VFDKSEVTFRNKLYPDYKAHRPPAPDDLIPQFALIRDACAPSTCPAWNRRLRGRRSDRDLCADRRRRGATTTIVSSDKDLMQLVTDKVMMYDTMKDRRIGIPEVIEKFGVPPEKVVEVQALAGDSTDNVPGVPGIGIKTAAQLIVEYGDLEQLLFRAGEIKQPKRREALIENAEKARISRQAGAARRQGRSRSAARRSRRARAGRAQADRLPEGDGILHPHPPRRRLFADRSVDVEADARQAERRSAPAPAKASRRQRPATCLPAPRRAAGKAGDRQDKAASLKGTPISLAERARKRRASCRSTAANTRRSRRSRSSTPRRRASTTPVMSRSRREPTPSIRCRPICAASRWRWRRTRPATCRSRTSSPVAAPGLCSTRVSRRTRSKHATRSKRCGRC
jgi:DNA polymerase-1